MRRRHSSSSLRVLLTHVYSWPEVRRGGERYLHELAAALHEAGHDVEVWSSSTQPGQSRVLDVPVTYFRRRHLLPARFGDWSDEVAFGLEAMARAVGRRRFDVWHALGTADAAAAAALSSLGRLHSVHTTLGVPDRAYRDNRPDRLLHEFVVRRVDEYVCLSETARAALQSGWGRQGQVVGGGVDLRRFTVSTDRHVRPALLYSGSFSEPRKNLGLLFEAAAILRETRPEVELWMSGSGDVDSLLLEAPAPAQKAVVRMGVGAESEQADRYRRAWVTVLPSDDEAFGLCLIESLACGTPIVVLEKGGGPAEILRPGVGFACKRSAEDLANACDQALDLATLKDTPAACREVAELYDWRTSVAPRIAELYRS